MQHQRKISVVGLGYVGLPVAVAFSKLSQVKGFDVDSNRISSLKAGHDWTDEITSEELECSQIEFTDNLNDLIGADFHIIAVPTPVDENHTPDLFFLKEASRMVGSILKQGDIVVFESTVYPGATEEICAPILEKHSKLTLSIDFNIGYSPERINPGDRMHTFSQITKVVSAQNLMTLDIIADVYGSAIEAGIHKASSIKVAEAAKVIENTQRDLNIALMNELAIVFSKMHIDTADVLEAAGTKWNFMPFAPGFVGGHCIGVDPYYLTFKAKQLGYRPEVILAGRKINDNMAKYVADEVIKKMILAGCLIHKAKVLILGLTFKENCPDLRNSKVVDLICELKSYGVQVVVHDPLACPEQAKQYYDIELSTWDEIQEVDAIILSVAHKNYLEMNIVEFDKKLNHLKLIFDVKSKLDREQLAANNINLWRL